MTKRYSPTLTRTCFKCNWTAEGEYYYDIESYRCLYCEREFEIPREENEEPVTTGCPLCSKQVKAYSNGERISGDCSECREYFEKPIEK